MLKPLHLETDVVTQLISNFKNLEETILKFSYNKGLGFADLNYLSI